MTALIVIAAVIAVFAIILSVPLSCEFYFRYDNEAEQSVILKYGFIRLPAAKRKEKPERKKTEKSPSKKDGASQTRALAGFCRENIGAVKKMIYAVLGYMFKRMVKINRLKIKLVFGLDDAMETALIYGAVSAFIFNMLGVMDRKMRLCEHITDVKPAFNNPHIFAETEIKVSTIMGRILMLAIIGIWHGVPLFIQYKKTIKDSDNREEKK